MAGKQHAVLRPYARRNMGRVIDYILLDLKRRRDGGGV